MRQDATQGSGRLDGRVAVVTGGSRGIGFATARAFVGAGARVTIVGRDPAALEQARLHSPEAVSIFQGDAGDPDCARTCVEQVIGRDGRIDILVNNVGGPLGFGKLLELPLDQLDATFALNVRGPLAWSRAAWAGWMQANGGVVVNLSSVSGARPVRLMGAYSIAKAALDQMTRVMAAELAPGVRVNGIAPGLTRTDATSAFSSRAELIDDIPLGRAGTPEDIAAAALFLAGDDGAWITGQTLYVDGGTLLGPPPRTKEGK